MPVYWPEHAFHGSWLHRLARAPLWYSIMEESGMIKQASMSEFAASPPLQLQEPEAFSMNPPLEL